jgi:hypothetical protein
MTLEYRVINPSRNPAAIVNGMVLNQILRLVRIPDLNESNLEKVPGNKILAPNISPAMVSITMANISIAP